MSHQIPNFGVLAVTDTSARWEAKEVVLDLHVSALDRDAARTVKYIADGLTEVISAEVQTGNRLRVVAQVARFKNKFEFAERVEEVLNNIAKAISTRSTAMSMHPSFTEAPPTGDNEPLIDEVFADDPHLLHQPFTRTYPARRG